MARAATSAATTPSQRVGRSLGVDGYVFIAAALRGSDFFGKTGGVQHLSGGGDQDHLEATVGAPEGLRPSAAHHIEGGGIGVGHGAVVT